MCMYNRIKEIRKTLNINQIDFAKQIGLSQSTLAMIEVGKRNFSDKHIKLICSTFNISEHWIKTGEGNMFNCSPYERELITIFENLSPITQKYLINIAKELLENQKELLSKNNP